MSGDISVRVDNPYETLQKIGALYRNGGEPSYAEALRVFSQAAAVARNIPQYDVVGMEALVDRLRYELKNIHMRTDGLNSINKLSMKVRVSRTYLAKFRDGGMVCMNIMNRIAAAFSIRYLIENYEDPKHAMID